MAKQKLKLPLNRTAPGVATDGDAALAAIPRKGKAKSPGKAKVVGKLKPVGKAKVVGKAKMRGAERGPSGPLPVMRKGIAKSKRQKRLPAAVPAAPLVTVLDVPPPKAVKAVARARTIRQGAPLGRLERLEIAIGEVRVGGRVSPRTRKLLASGIPKMAQKVIEEAAEVAIEAIRGDRVAFVNEAVDLFYNFLVVASELGVPLATVFAEMDRREQALGMAEKLPKSGEP